jgi:hypothetical protein
VTIIQGIPRPDGWEWQDLTPAERLAHARALATRKIPLLEEGRAKRTTRENRTAFDRVEPFRSGMTYAGRCTFGNGIYFEVVADDGSLSIHQRSWLTLTTDSRVVSPRAGDEISLKYAEWPHARANWRRRCKGCLQHWSLPERTYCETCLHECRWCGAAADSAIFGRPACRTCVTAWEPHQRRARASWTRWHDHPCFWCEERKSTEWIDRHNGIWKMRTGLTCCSRCRPEVEAWAFPHGRDADKNVTRDAGLCQWCRDGHIEFFMDILAENGRQEGSYRCRQCKGGAGVQARIPALILAGNLLRYEGGA